MEYILVKWIQLFTDEPVLLYCELDESRYETRKVEVFRNGKMGFASEDEEFGSTRLGIDPVPEISEIEKDLEFEPKEISKEEFEKIWSVRHNSFMH
jgi:hypothetical protein